MGKIVILDEGTSNKIAAGEVVERPASVVKEFVENSIDAGANSISIEIKNGGISYIKVSDNGCGMEEDDVQISLERHATSKIRSADDLNGISTMGFRGEALASIAAVSHLELTTRVKDQPHGIHLKADGGVITSVKQIGCPVGTTMVIRNLFYNTPARYKFLKKDTTEAGNIADIISRIALARPDISIKFSSNGSAVINTPGNGDLLSAIYSIYGKETARDALAIDYKDPDTAIRGYAGKPGNSRSNRSYQTFVINGRIIRSKLISSAIDEAYKTYLMKGRYPFVVLSLEVNPESIDVNVHPTKMEVKFSNDQQIFRSVYHAVTDALQRHSLVKNVQLEEKSRQDYKYEPDGGAWIGYAQQSMPKTGNDLGSKPSVWMPSIGKTIASTATNTADTSRIGTAIFQEPQPEYASGIPAGEVRVGFPSIEDQASNTSSDNEDEGIDHSANKNGTGIPSSPDLKPDALMSARLIGQLFSTYILFQLEDVFVMMDQHAVHERILYERYRRKFREDESMAQMLMVPVVLELTPAESGLLQEEKEIFIKAGFEFETFGNNSIIIRSVPVGIAEEDSRKLFLDLLDWAGKSGKSDFHMVADEVIYTIACKAAVKAKDALGEAEIRNLLKELTFLENPYTCPHGRPTLVKLTKIELEKMFKRVV